MSASACWRPLCSYAHACHGRRARHWVELWTLLAEQEEQVQPRTREQMTTISCRATDVIVRLVQITEDASVAILSLSAPNVFVGFQHCSSSQSFGQATWIGCRTNAFGLRLSANSRRTYEIIIFRTFEGLLDPWTPAMSGISNNFQKMAPFAATKKMHAPR